MLVPVVRVRPVGVRVGCGPVFVPVTVIDGLRHPWEQVMVMAVVMTMPVLMCGGLMMVRMKVSFEEEETERDEDNQCGGYLSQRNGFFEKNGSQDNPKKWRTGENDLASSGAEFLCRSDVKDDAYAIRENTNEDSCGCRGDCRGVTV